MSRHNVIVHLNALSNDVSHSWRWAVPCSCSNSLAVSMVYWCVFGSVFQHAFIWLKKKKFAVYSFYIIYSCSLFIFLRLSENLIPSLCTIGDSPSAKPSKRLFAVLHITYCQVCLQLAGVWYVERCWLLCKSVKHFNPTSLWLPISEGNR